jgi:hypothetical protein
MALRGIQPDAVEKRLKCLMYGVSGAGKTYAAISFPKPYLIDAEKGSENSQYCAQLKKTGGAVFRTTDFDEMLAEIKELAINKHDYRTLVIDPLTVIYNNVLEQCATKRITAQNPDGMAHGGHYIASNAKMKQLMGLLLKLDMNVIITSHSKTEYGHNMTVLGNTYDCYKKLDYLFDLVFEIKKGALDSEAIVKKSRVENFNQGDRFPFSYDEIADRYGREILEKVSDSKIFATNEQVLLVTDAIESFNVSRETIDKWLTKAGVSALEDMPYNAMDAVIKHFESKQQQEETQQ